MSSVSPARVILSFACVACLGGALMAQEPPKSTEEKPAAQKPAAELQKPESDAPNKDKQSPPPPTTKTLPQPKDITAPDALLAPPPAPKGKVSLIGGTVRNMDQIRNRMELNIFGGGKMKFFFDERSHFYRDGVEGTQLAVKKGDRVYVDSQLDQGKIFARKVHVQSERPVGAASGQVLAYNPRSGELTLNEPISSRPLYFRVTKETTFRRGDQPGSVADLRRNAIVKVSFRPVPGNRAEVREVELVAVPGTRFQFYGKLTHLDLRSGIMGIENQSDSRLYEVHFRPTPQTVTDDLVIGAQLNIIAIFTGKDYSAESIQIVRPAQSGSVQ